jgi:hypothetical protein
MTDLFVDPYQQSYPPSLWGGGTTPPNPLNITDQFPGIKTLTDFGALEASGLYGNTGTSKPAAAFTAGQFVKTADDARAHWDGTKWVVGAAPGTPPAPPPDDDGDDPVDPTVEVIFVDPDDAVVRLDLDADGDTDATVIVDVDDDETTPPS